MQAVVRHGARNPGAGDIRKLIALDKLLDEHTELVRASEHPWAADWNTSFVAEEQHLLTTRGEEEQYRLAQRLKALFPDIFAENYMATRYRFSETEVSRASHSASAFVYGLFEGRGTVGEGKFQPVDVLSVGKSNDRLLRFFDTCPAYVHHNSGPESKKRVTEQDLFEQTSHMTEMRAALAQRLNLPRPLSLKEVHGVYRACSYETVETGTLSPMCTLLGEDGLLIMEFYDDLKQWWQKSYGMELNYRMACPLLADIFAVMDSVAAGKSQLRAGVRFAHAETVMPLQALLGLYRDAQPLTHNMTRAQMDARVFRSSVVSPFSANVVFVLYACADGEFLVKLLVNEKEELIPGCTDTYCPYNTAKAVLKHTMECQFDKECALPVAWWNPRGLAGPFPEALRTLDWANLAVLITVVANLHLIWSLCAWLANHR